jgi:hypothetical protein
MDLGVGQQVADLPVGRVVSVELPVVGVDAAAAADSEARRARFAFDACLAGELYEPFGFAVVFGSGHWCSSL